MILYAFIGPMPSTAKNSEVYEVLFIELSCMSNLFSYMSYILSKNMPIGAIRLFEYVIRRDVLCINI
jgi:hypothetical protein